MSKERESRRVDRPYSVKLTKKATKKFGAYSGEVLENGVIIARFQYKPKSWPQLEAKFGSEASKNRFDSYCDSLSMTETIEALSDPWGQFRKP